MSSIGVAVFLAFFVSEARDPLTPKYDTFFCVPKNAMVFFFILRYVQQLSHFFLSRISFFFSGGRGLKVPKIEETTKRKKQMVLVHLYYDRSMGLSEARFRVKVVELLPRWELLNFLESGAPPGKSRARRGYDRRGITPFSAKAFGY